MPDHLVTNLFADSNHNTTDQFSGMQGMIQKQAEENRWIIVSENRDHDPQQIVDATYAYHEHPQAKSDANNKQ